LSLENSREFESIGGSRIPLLRVLCFLWPFLPLQYLTVQRIFCPSYPCRSKSIRGSKFSLRLPKKTIAKTTKPAETITRYGALPGHPFRLKNGTDVPAKKNRPRRTLYTFFDILIWRNGIARIREKKMCNFRRDLRANIRLFRNVTHCYTNKASPPGGGVESTGPSSLTEIRPPQSKHGPNRQTHHRHHPPPQTTPGRTQTNPTRNPPNHMNSNSTSARFASNLRA
jgi:hypothetical protein